MDKRQASGDAWQCYDLGPAISPDGTLGELWEKMRQFLAQTNPDLKLPGFDHHPDSPFTLWSGKWVQILGYGVAWACSPTGPDRFQQANQLWSSYLASLKADSNHPSIPKELTFPIALGSFGFTDQEHSQLFAPEVTIVHYQQHYWVIVLPKKVCSDQNSLATAKNRLRPDTTANQTPIAKATPPLSYPDWENAVQSGTKTLQTGQAEKIVLARDALYQQQPLPHLGLVLEELSRRYPDCWTFKIGDLFGATPEMLAQVKAQKLLCRVLAGTCRPGEEAQLWTCPKERKEHEVAVASASDALGPLLANLQVPAQPFLLRLKNVTHLASDLQSDLAALPSNTENTYQSALAFAGALHPTAAVCGRPRAKAQAIISQLEPFARGHYAAPIGWLDARGNGEWAIALRCAQIVSCDQLDGFAYRLWAGAGIMPQSEPRAEWNETQAKMASVKDTLDSVYSSLKNRSLT